MAGGRRIPVPFDGLTSLYVVSALFGLSQGGIVPSYALIVREYFPAREAGARVSLVLMPTVSGTLRSPSARADLLTEPEDCHTRPLDLLIVGPQRRYAWRAGRCALRASGCGAALEPATRCVV
ncbi:MAG TPA: hypothetical protein VFZ10_09935 [Geminicoccaceae bacterium]